MANMLVFLRHAKTLVDSSVSIDKWVLNEQGIENANWLASTVQFDDVSGSDNRRARRDGIAAAYGQG